MPLLRPLGSQMLTTYRNWGTNPAVTAGVTVTPGASNVKGSWAIMATGANLNFEVCMIEVWFHTITGTLDRQIAIDIGVDPAGGTSYTTVIANIIAGNMPGGPGGIGGGTRFLFPIRVPSGSQVAIRASNSNATAGTFIAACRFVGVTSRPEMALCGQYAETIGTVSGSAGVTFTPGNAADGTWASLGTTTQPLWWWQLAYSVADGTMSAQYTYIDLAFGDASNKHIIKTLFTGNTSAEVTADLAMSNMMYHQCYCPVPANTNMYVRGRCSTTPDSGYNAVAIGIGG
jgi:hypothetical protein